MYQALLPRVHHLLVRHCTHHYGGRWLSSLAVASYGSGERRRGQQEEESKAVKVSVWWDFENCHVPAGVNVACVGARITAALRASGIRGPVSITAFGDVIQLARCAQEALAATGVALSHVPRTGKDSSDRSFMADLIYWIAQNPPPAHFFLISGDKDFTNILHRLRMNNYNVLLACPNTATSVLCSAATIMWRWEALVKGGDFSPKHFNHPPDGSPGSWYGHYKGALDDPFFDTESEESMAFPSDTKPRVIPKPVVDGIRYVLSSYPDGMNISDLRLELKRNNVFVDKSFFGYQKFSALLQSMPAIVKFLDPLPGTNQPIVVGVHNRSVEPALRSCKTLDFSQSNVGEKSLNHTQNEKPPPSDVQSSPADLLSKDQKKSPPAVVSSSPSDLLSREQKKSPPADLTAQSVPPANHKEADLETSSRTSSSPTAQDTISKRGLFERIWTLCNGPEPMNPEVSPSHVGICSIGAGDLPTHQSHNADHHKRLLKRILKAFPRTDNSNGNNSTSAVSSNLSNISSKDMENLTNMKRDASVHMSKAEQLDDSAEKQRNKGIFSWVERWWKFGKSDADDNTTCRNVTGRTRTDSDKESESVKTLTSASRQQVGNEMFTKSYFWDAFEQYLLTSSGSDLISKAKTRVELARGLQEQGLWPLKGLHEKDLHHLVDLLVSEKRWVEESPSKSFPFQLTIPQKRTCVPLHSSKSNGLSSLFSNGKLLDQGKYVDDRSRTNMTPTPAREEILSDCHKLLKELLLRYEYGFRISTFNQIFSHNFGYELDHQKLGYPELESLLRIMPGVRIKFHRVLPAENGKDEVGDKGNGNQSNGDDLIWEELGPVSDTGKTHEEIDKGVSYCPPTLSDDEFSDDDKQAGKQPRKDAAQSSLLHIIDSWNTSKDGGSNKKSHSIDGLVDCSGCSPSYPNNLIPESAQKPMRQPHKYTFVSDSEDYEKNKLVDSVLGSLQKARSSRLHG